MMLRVLDSVSQPYSIEVILGRDWFTTCSTSLKDNPEDAVPVCLSSSHQWLIFAASPVKFVLRPCRLVSSTSSMVVIL